MAVSTEDGAEIQALNLSTSGMLIESTAKVSLFHEMSFRFKLPGGAQVSGRARAIRQAAANQYGLEFLKLDGDGKDAIDDYVRSAGVR